MNGIEIDLGAARASVASLAAANSAIAAQLSQLETEAATLLGAWAGDAQVAYNTAQAQWSGNMARMNALLDASRQVLADWADAIEQLEGELATGWPG